jgi:hypothetical protein
MIAVRCEDSPTGDHEPRPDRWGDAVCVWCLEDTTPPSDAASDRFLTDEEFWAKNGKNNALPPYEETE